jgi:hypothetical protein
MSYTTGTTHYNLPQTVGSDKRDWTDTNEAFSDVDAALWEAHQGATQAALDITSINSEIQTITGKQADDEADIATISGKVSTLETTVANHTTEIGDVRRDLQDNIESSREDTATSTHAYEIGDYFYYNDVLFKATAQIAIGATIVPNTNCTGVTVMSEFVQLSPGGEVAADDVSFDPTGTDLVGTNVESAIKEVNSKISASSTFGTAVDLSSYSTEQNSYTTPSEGYVVIESGATAGSYMSAVINTISMLTVRTASESAVERHGLYVRAGMSVYGYGGGGGTGTIKFYPFS